MGHFFQWKCICGYWNDYYFRKCGNCSELRLYYLTQRQARAVARKLNRLETENRGLSAMLAAATLSVARPHQKMPCSHERRFIIGEANDPNWCALCLLKKMQENPNSVWVIGRKETTDEVS